MRKAACEEVADCSMAGEKTIALVRALEANSRVEKTAARTKTAHRTFMMMTSPGKDGYYYVNFHAQSETAAAYLRCLTLEISLRQTPKKPCA